MTFSYIILTPFVWLLEFFYNFVGTYGMALILFTLVIKLILFPFSLKSKRSMIKTNMLSGEVQKIQKRYAKDSEKMNAEIQKLYEKEGVSPMAGCLWSFLPLLILIPLYAIIRQPIKYMMGVTGENMDAMLQAIAQTVNWSSAAVERGWIKEAAEFVNTGYNQLYLSSLITRENLTAVTDAVLAVGTPYKDIMAINFQFLGIDLASVPQVKFWASGMTWSSIGLFLIPLLSAGSTVLMTVISTKTNNMNSQQNPEAAKSNRMMMLISPVMYLFFGFSMPAALSIYLMSSSLLGIVQELICGKMLKKDYEKAEAERKKREQEEKEEEKRLRREKAEQRAKEAEEARKNKKKKVKETAEEDAKIPAAVRQASRVGIRQYARGRNYDPDRYGGVTPYHEDVANKILQQAEEVEATEEKPAGPETIPEVPAGPRLEDIIAPESLPDGVTMEDVTGEAAPEEPAREPDDEPKES